MNDARARWGLPDWTDEAAYPKQPTDPEWRWEFLRRRHDYRAEWDRWQGSVIEQGGVLTAITDDFDQIVQQFGVAVIYDPRHRFEGWEAWQLFRHPYGFVVNYDPRRRERDRRFADYRFDLGRPLEPQITKARKHLLQFQAELYGKQATPRPSRELWPLYLRLLDARDCGATWKKIADIMGKPVDSVRSSHRRAEGLRDNFPV